MENERIIRNFTIGCLIAFIFYLCKQVITLNKISKKMKSRIRDLEKQLGLLAESFARFLDVDERDKAEMKRAINSSDIKDIIFTIRGMTWKEFANSSYYTSPSYYMYDDNSLRSRTILYLTIIASANIYSKYVTDVFGIKDVNEAVDYISENKERVNKLESLLKNAWDQSIQFKDEEENKE